MPPPPPAKLVRVQSTFSRAGVTAATKGSLSVGELHGLLRRGGKGHPVESVGLHAISLARYGDLGRFQ